MRLSTIFFLSIVSITLWGQILRFPEIDVYSEIGTNGSALTRHRIFLSVDGGAKYGFRLDFAMKGLYTNAPLPGQGATLVPAMDTLFFQTEPFGLFEMDYFLGNWRTLAKKEYGYRGLQFFFLPWQSYEGAYELRGVGVAFGKNFLDGMLYPHLLIYQSLVDERVGFDVVVDSRIGNTVLEFSVGFSDVNLYQAVVDNTLEKRYSILIRSVYGKLNFEIGIGFPNSALTNLPLFEEAYIHLAEHLVVGYFEQNLAIFARPTHYNGVAEVLRQDIDFYFSAGAKVLSYGAGFENTFMMSTNYQLSDRIGLYLYNDLSTIRFKMGIFYNVLDGIWGNPYGMYFTLQGKI